MKIGEFTDVIGTREGAEKTQGGLCVAQIDMTELEVGKLKRIKDLMKQEQMRPMFGRECKTPRLVGQFGAEYNFSGTHMEAQTLPVILRFLIQAVNTKVKGRYNACHANYYRDGTDSIGRHADDEDGLDPTCGVVSVAFGQPRKFCLRENGKKGFIDWQPEDRKPHIIWMWGNFQETHTHEIPKQLRIKGDDAWRMSFTFRMHM